jgi:hypothetical protein
VLLFPIKSKGGKLISILNGRSVPTDVKKNQFYDFSIFNFCKEFGRSKISISHKDLGSVKK